MCAFISSDVELTNPYFIYIVKPLIHKTKQAADATSLINFRGRGLTDWLTDYKVKSSNHEN